MYVCLTSGSQILCCSVLQCVAVCCRVLQCVAVCCSVFQCIKVMYVCLTSGSQILRIVQYKFSNLVRRIRCFKIWSSARDYAVLDLFLNIVDSFISAWPKRSGGNDVYHSGASSQNANRRGRPLNILHDSLGRTDIPKCIYICSKWNIYICVCTYMYMFIYILRTYIYI